MQTGFCGLGWVFSFGGVFLWFVILGYLGGGVLKMKKYGFLINKWRIINTNLLQSLLLEFQAVCVCQRASVRTISWEQMKFELS